MWAGGEVEICPARVYGFELLAKGAWVSSVPARALDVGRKSGGDNGAGIGRSEMQRLEGDAKHGDDGGFYCSRQVCFSRERKEGVR